MANYFPPTPILELNQCHSLIKEMFDNIPLDVRFRHSFVCVAIGQKFICSILQSLFA